MTNYSTPGAFTDLKGVASPVGSVELALVQVQKLLQPAFQAKSSSDRVFASGIRSAAEIYRVATSAVEEHEPKVCGDARSYCVLLVGLLRASAIPCRVRCAFVNYLENERWTSRWLVEVLARNDTQLIDPQLDADGGGKTTGVIDAHHLANDAVRQAPTAWHRVRQGKEDARLYGFATHRGLSVLRESLYRDVCALSGLELLSTDHLFGIRNEQSMSERELDLLDELAAAARKVDKNPKALERLFSETPELGRSVLFQLGLSRNDSREWPKSNANLLDYILSDQGGRNDSESSIETLEDGADIGVLKIRGAVENNLKDVDVDIPHGKFVVVTGLSGSGKSSLAFDTVFAASQHRFVESLSPYLRRHMDKIQAPRVRSITGLPPAISIEQKTVSRNPRSSVGTITRIAPLVRLLFSRAGQRHCMQCGHAIEPVNAVALAKRASEPHFACTGLLAAVDNANLATVNRCLARADRAGATTCISADNQPLPWNAEALLPANDPRIVIAQRRSVTNEDVRTALDVGDGVVVLQSKKGEVRLSDRAICPSCRLASPEMTSENFSVTSDISHCETCGGVGVLAAVDERALVQFPSRNILDGAISWYTELRSGKQTGWPVGKLDEIAEYFDERLETPWNETSSEFRQAILYGLIDPRRRTRDQTQPKIKGLIPEIERLHRSTESSGSRKKYDRFMKKSSCPECRGTGLKQQALAVHLEGRTFDQVQDMTMERLHIWASALLERPHPKAIVIRPIAREIHRRASNVVDVGLPYLSLNRSAPTLSGGEGQRLRLARQLDIGLTNILYVLDEPSIGLHVSDIDRLLTALRRLQSIGNSVLVVEHDEATMRAADLIIEMGPGAGQAGGHITALGRLAEIEANARSVTGAFLSGRRSVRDGLPPVKPVGPTTNWIRLSGARHHNLQDVDVAFPMGHLSVVTGVSGSGKSTLINQILVPALVGTLRQNGLGKHFEKLEVEQPITNVLEVDQTPIGRTPRSCPATYLELMDDIRDIFAATADARRLGLGKNYFSFNSNVGRCPTCEGLGSICVEMHFLPAVWTPCPECRGNRYKDEVLGVKWRGLTISEVLALDISESRVLFREAPKVDRRLKMAEQVGLGYLSLGQSAASLSGGEAQRLKLGRELLGGRTENCIYVLDEPTTGLHFADINRLLGVVRQLVDHGHTVIVIEHNLDVIKSADWIVDLGPGGGDKGGKVLYQGTPAGLSSCLLSITGQWLDRAPA